MSFDPAQLKRIALAKRATRDQVEAPTDSRSQWTQEQIDVLLKDIENTVVTFAEEGNLSVDYNFKSEVSVSFIYEVASQFKLIHPRLMTITSEGEKKVTLTWEE